MPTLTKRIAFSASHYYWIADLPEAENVALFRQCANPDGHGHDYQVEVSLRGPIQPETGMIINFFDLEPILQRAVLEPLDHKNLNRQVEYFKAHVPTLENIAIYLWERLAPQVSHAGLALDCLKVIESSDLYVEMRETSVPC